VDELQLQRLRYVLSQSHEEKPASWFSKLFRKRAQIEQPVPQELGQILLKPVRPPRRDKAA